MYLKRNSTTHAIASLALDVKKVFFVHKTHNKYGHIMGTILQWYCLMHLPLFTTSVLKRA